MTARLGTPHKQAGGSAITPPGRPAPPLTEALAGHAIGSLAGIAMAVLLVAAPWTRCGLMPVLLAINAVPVAAYSPLVLLWLGLGMPSKVVTVALAVDFTVFLSTLTGFDRVDRHAAGLLRSFGAGPSRSCGGCACRPRCR